MIQQSMFVMTEQKGIIIFTMQYPTHLSEALDILQDYIMEKGNGKKIDPKQIQRNCQNLLVASASSSSGGPKETERLLDLLVVGGFVEPNNLSLGALVKSRLKW